MALAIGLAMLRVITKINLLWIIVPGYAIALALTFVVPSIFTGIAFDSGGVASGPMTATFLLPFTAGAASAISGALGVNETFGVVALVAMMPLLAIQIIGLIFKVKTTMRARLVSGYFSDMLAHEGDIIDLSSFVDRKSARSAFKDGLDERIKNLRSEIDSLKEEIAKKRAELTRYIKRRSNFNKDE